MTYREAVLQGERLLEAQGILDAGQDAWLLLAMVCGIKRDDYYMHMQEELPDIHRTAYESLLKKRAERVPLQYLTKEQAFMGLSFFVNSDVLIPRQDTETLVEEALKELRPGMEALDLCTGSGCIAISLAWHRKGIAMTASDISDKALEVARENARRHAVSIRLIVSDLFASITGRFDLVVSNPPYIPTEEIDGLMPEVRDYEPRGALDGKKDGLQFYRRIILDAPKYLKAKGRLLLEIGYDQGEAVSGLLYQAGYQGIRTVKDLGGNDRVVMARVP